MQDADDLGGRLPVANPAFERWLLLRSELFQRRHASSSHKLRDIREYLDGVERGS